MVKFLRDNISGNGYRQATKHYFKSLLDQAFKDGKIQRKDQNYVEELYNRAHPNIRSKDYKPIKDIYENKLKKRLEKNPDLANRKLNDKMEEWREIGVKLKMEYPDKSPTERADMREKIWEELGYGSKDERDLKKQQKKQQKKYYSIDLGNGNIYNVKNFTELIKNIGYDLKVDKENNYAIYNQLVKIWNSTVNPKKPIKEKEIKSKKTGKGFYDDEDYESDY